MVAPRGYGAAVIESVRIAAWHELAPAIGTEPPLIRAIARRTPQVFDQMPLGTLLAATVREPNDAWIVMVRDRLAALPSPDDDVSRLLPTLAEICAARIGDIEALMAEMRRQRDPDLQHELEALDDARVALESALGQTLRMLVH